jgi:RNA polymerase sigma factor (sigma-70 family)
LQLMVSHSSNIMTDEALISSLATGDSKTIQYIYKTIYPSVEKMVFKMNGSTHDAYDVFQDSVTILYEKAKAGNLDIACKVSTYLIAIAKNIWLTKLTKRKKNSFTVLHEHHEDEISVEGDIRNFLEFERNVEKLNACFSQIGEPCNELLKSFYIHNHSMQEIAEKFGYTNSENAKNQKYKCLMRLRKLFFKHSDKVEEHERTI